jgi:hypothetical protein
MSLKEARNQAATLIQSALDKRIEYLKTTDAFKALQTDLQNFEENGNPDSLWIDGDYLYSGIRIYLDRELCTDEDGNPDPELAEEILTECSDVPYYEQDDYSQGYFEWKASQCLGSAVMFNDSPERNCYAIYCSDLDLKLNRKDYTDEEHGFLLIEKAMRDSGYFPSVVSVDHCGLAVYLTTPREIARMSDADLTAALAAKTAEREE